MDEIQAQITSLEAEMNSVNFWADKAHAQAVIKQIQELKDKALGGAEFDKHPAVITIFSGAGGDDAEDFTGMLFLMYRKLAVRRGWQIFLIHEHANDHGGYRNISFEIAEKGAYGILKNESGVHRLVRVSPFSSKKLRHTSFSLVEVIPRFGETEKVDIPDADLKIEFSKSSGPGGQNVNKRETAVRLTHIPTGLTVHAETERSQQANTRRALLILKGKLYKLQEDERQAKEKNMYISKTTSAEWGSQIRSYVLHPYKMVKDHRTGAETSDVEAVLDGDIDLFLDAEKKIGSGTERATM